MVSVIYMVAGMSSRFNGKIKQFAKVGPNGETLIEYSIEQAVKGGVDEIIFIVGEKTELPFKELFGDDFKGTPIKYAKQSFDPELRDRPWGTVDAIIAMKDIMTQPGIICNGDDLYGTDSFKILVEKLNAGENATLGYRLFDTLPDVGEVNRGIFEVTNGVVKFLKETFDISKENLELKTLNNNSMCSMNFFGLTPEIISLLNETLVEFKKEHEGDKKAECLLPVELGRLILEEKLKLFIYPTTEQWYGVTNPEDEEVVRELLKKNLEEPNL